MTPDTTQARHIARLRDAERAADNARRMKEFDYRWLAISGGVKPGPKRVNWREYRRCMIWFPLAILVIAGAGIAMGW